MAKIWTGKTLREVVGVGAVVDSHHEGPTKRPTEVSRLDDFRPVAPKTIADFFRERDEKEGIQRAKQTSETER